MPKGGDLHLHLTGAVYAESFIREAAADKSCVNEDTLALVDGTARGAACPAKSFPSAKALSDQATWDRLINAYSVRSFVAHTGYSEHDQFFGHFPEGRWTYGGCCMAANGWMKSSRALRLRTNEYIEVMHVPRRWLGAWRGWRRFIGREIAMHSLPN